MKNYMTFEQLINRVRYGTDICVIEDFTGKQPVFSGKHLPRIKKRGRRHNRFDDTVLDADVTQITVENGMLRIEIVKQEETHAG
jgi:hypothetical protein